MVNGVTYTEAKIPTTVPQLIEQFLGNSPKITKKKQPYRQRLREYRFHANIGRGVNIGCDSVFTLYF